MVAKPNNFAFTLKASMVSIFKNHTNDKDIAYVEKIAKDFEANQRRLKREHCSK